MKKTIKLTEKDLNGLVKKIMHESKYAAYKGNFSYSDFIDKYLLQDVIDRMNSFYCEGCGEEYKKALKDFNSNWTLDPRKTRRM